MDEDEMEMWYASVEMKESERGRRKANGG